MAQMTLEEMCSLSRAELRQVIQDKRMQMGDDTPQDLVDEIYTLDQVMDMRIRVESQHPMPQMTPLRDKILSLMTGGKNG